MPASEIRGDPNTLADLDIGYQVGDLHVSVGVYAFPARRPIQPSRCPIELRRQVGRIWDELGLRPFAGHPSMLAQRAPPS
jgi:hypothetical protein